MMYSLHTKHGCRIFHFFDANGKRELDFHSFVVCAWCFCYNDEEDILAFIFDLYDEDNSGGMDYHELKEFFTQVNGTAKKIPFNTTELLELYYGTEDVLSKENFIDWVMQHKCSFTPIFSLRKAMRVRIFGSVVWSPKYRPPPRFLTNTYLKQCLAKDKNLKSVPNIEEDDFDWKQTTFDNVGDNSLTNCIGGRERWKANYEMKLWRMKRDKYGREFWYNTKTKKVQWEKPDFRPEKWQQPEYKQWKLRMWKKRRKKQALIRRLNMLSKQASFEEEDLLFDEDL